MMIKILKPATIAVAAAALFAAAGCEKDTTIDDNKPDQPAEQMTFRVAMPAEEDIQTRMAFDDDKVSAGEPGALTWEADDRLMVVGFDEKGNYIGWADDFVYRGVDGATSGSFTGPKIRGATKFNIYYPNTVAVDAAGEVTYDITSVFQTQTANASTEHLSQVLFLAATQVTESSSFTLNLQNSIMKFSMTNIPAEVGALKTMIWNVETADGVHSQYLDFAEGAVTFAPGTSALTAYLAIPAGTGVKPGGKFSAQLLGDKSYKATLTSTNGKDYQAGNRYTASMSAWEVYTATMAFKVTLSGSNLSFSVPFPTSGTTPAEITVDWGDQSSVTVPAGTTLSDTDEFNHTYATAGTYAITLTSAQNDSREQQIPEIAFNTRTANDNASKLISVDTPLLNMETTNFAYCFYDCRSLTSIPEGLFNYNKQADDFRYSFCGCSSLTSIPEGLFDYNKQAASFYYSFCDCSSLTSIPEGLFDKNTQADDFRYSFCGCSSLTSIPEGLFDKNTQADDFSNSFLGCSSLTGIPATLFANNTLVTTFDTCFGYCSSLTSIPEGLFDYNTLVTDFDSCFYECSSLTSIPEGLFNKNTLVTTFDSCFYECNSLTSIPEGLFDNNMLVTTFNSCFKGCSSLINIPEGLFDNNTQAIDFYGCFEGCSSLTSIPEGLFDYNTQVTNGFYYCFSGCSSLTGIPATLFANNTLTTSFTACFEDCSSLTGIPATLFANNTQVVEFNSCFSGCSSLTSIPEGLFDYNTRTLSFNWCFNGCNSLINIPDGLFDKNTLVTNFGGCFKDCSSLTGIPEGLFNNNTLATYFRSCFDGCTKSVLNKNIFSSTADPDRFANLNMDFTRCFFNACNSVTIYTSDAPELWNYNRGTGNWSTDLCFHGAYLTNKYDSSFNIAWGVPRL